MGHQLRAISLAGRHLHCVRHFFLLTASMNDNKFRGANDTKLMTCVAQISAQRFHNRIMQHWPEISDSFVVATRMYPIGQKDDDNRTIQIHPEGGACKT